MRPVNAAALGTVLTLLGPVASADAASRLVVRGAGFGHGIGMSQYGAYGFALQGQTHEQILRHYYTGTQLARLSGAKEVRVLLGSGRTATVLGGAVSAGETALDPGRRYTVRAGGQGVVLRGGGQQLTAPVLRVAGEGALRTVSGTWRGALELRPVGGGVQVVNAVGLEDYVRGVVAKESPSSWPMEALRAQAIAARTYALTTTKNGNGFDHFRDVRSQVYGGVGAETPSTDVAVQSTAGKVVTYRGTPVTTFFFSTSGGRTEDVENSFIGGTPQPWLRSVPDPYDGISPKHRWGPLRFTVSQATARLRGLVKGRFKRVEVVQRGSSPRIVRARVVGTRGVTDVTGPQLRARFGLDDTWATFTTVRSTVRARPAKAGGSPDARAADVRGSVVKSLTGTIRPARRGATVRLQQRVAGRWSTVGSTRIGARGRYAVTVPQRGTYRVAYGKAVSGPAVRVR